MPSLLFPPEVQFCDAQGKPYAGGTITTYIPDTTTPKATWSEHTGTAQNTNPIVLDAAGRCLMFGDGEYRLVLRDAAGNQVYDQWSTTIVSAAMQAVVAAPDIATARSLLGIDAAIAAEAALRSAADTAEANARTAADNTLQTNINNEAAARTSADNTLQTNINNETTRAQAAEANLQSQISAIPIPGAGGTTHTGTSTTDASGNFTATWPAFTSTFIGFNIPSTDPVFAGAGFTTTAITLSSYTATLLHSNNLYPTATTTIVANTTFHWQATGF